MDLPCPACRCTHVAGTATHAVVGALADDDLDGAIEAGLLHARACEGCTGECTARLIEAREERRRALAARDRYRVRQARLQCRAEERALARMPATASASTTAPALPSTAAAALARAKARAAERRKP